MKLDPREKSLLLLRIQLLLQGTQLLVSLSDSFSKTLARKKKSTAILQVTNLLDMERHLNAEHKNGQ